MVGSDRMLVIDGVGVASSVEEVSVTAINLAGLRSTPVLGRVVFQTTPPHDTGELRERGREGGREGRRKGGREGGREGEREGGREGGILIGRYIYN